MVIAAYPIADHKEGGVGCWFCGYKAVLLGIAKATLGEGFRIIYKNLHSFSCIYWLHQNLLDGLGH